MFIQDKGVAKSLMETKDKHREFIRFEKLSYYDHRSKGRIKPTPQTKKKYMSIIIDGMDQAKTNSPQLARSRKDTDSLTMQGNHIIGVLNHGSDVPVLCYVNDDSIPSDSNLNMQIITDVIKQEQALLGYLPEVCYWQMDSAPDNKNRWMLTLAAMFVAVSLFRKIKISFLPKGHTHEDIDQLFSKLAEFLRNRDILSFDNLASAIAECGLFEGQKPIVKPVHTLLDFKGLVDDIMPPYKAISQPMCFKFERDESGENVLCFAKKDLQTSKRSDPECWFPEDGYVVCSVADARKVWSTQVAAIQPRDMDLNELHKTVDKYVELTLMDDIQQACWDRELGRLETSLQERCGHCADLRHKVCD